LNVEIFADPDDLADMAATRVATLLRAALAARSGPATLWLSGGSTPRVTYVRLLDEEVDWERVHVFLGDERWVPVDHEQSNAGMAREAFLDEVGATFHVVPTHLESPHEAATAYEKQLAAVFGDAPFEPDVVLLGIGADGHTASLFPNTEALAETDRYYAANWVEEQDAWRITATYRLLHSARHIIFLVTGAGKAEVVAEILEAGVDHPARRVMEGAADVTWFLDDAAASLLSTPGG
jgi:6-phosphogluconolactonase